MRYAREIAGSAHEVIVDGDAGSPPAATLDALTAFFGRPEVGGLSALDDARAGGPVTAATFSAAVAAAIFARLESKANKDYARADEVRRLLESLGVSVRDGKSQTTAVLGAARAEPAAAGVSSGSVAT